MYLWYLISRPGDLLPAPTWSYITRSSRMASRSIPARFRRADSQPTFATALQLLHAGVVTPIRVIKTLYRLGCVMEQNPRLLTFGGGFLTDIPTPDDDDQTVSIVESEEPATNKEYFKVGAPATASQIYHAAILNGNTLDDLLAVFEVSNEPASINDSPETVHHDLPSKHDCGRYRDSSIQTTSERLTTPGESSIAPQGYRRNGDTALDERPYGQLAKAPGSEKKHLGNGMKSSPLLSSPVTNSCCQPEGDLTQAQICENTSPEHSECPIFARRQAQSRLPQRAKNATKPQHMAVNATTALPAANVDAMPPSRNKLQRRAWVS
jgi:hypothetical protein